MTVVVCNFTCDNCNSTLKRVSKSYAEKKKGWCWHFGERGNCIILCANCEAYFEDVRNVRALPTK